MANNIDDDNRVSRRIGKSWNAGLSDKVPLPNIVRIEVLNAKARNKYLGKIGQAVSNFRDLAYEGSRSVGLDKFFGFMKGAPKTSVGITARWGDGGNSGGVTGAITGVVGNIVNSVLGAGPGELKSAASTIGDIGRDLTGINASATGSSSLKRYNGGGLKGFTLSCGWYLPEQHDLCLKSLKALFRMVYPVQVAADKDKIEQLYKVLTNSTSGLNNAVSGPAQAVETPTDGASVPFIIQNQANSSNIAAPTNTQKDLLDGAIKVAASATDKLKDAARNILGINLTFDPIPVRVSVGQYVDIEPLVITEANAEFSGETFINETGRHLPIFCTVTISFDFWMMPAPNSEFMALLGHEIFGD